MADLTNMSNDDFLLAPDSDRVAFFSRPYWSRLWIIQELCAAKDIVVVCGHDTVPWPSLSRKTRDDRFYIGLMPSNSVEDFRLLIPYNLVDLRNSFKSFQLGRQE